MIRASVIICTINPRLDYLNRALRSLANQTISQDRWELIVVDNASDKPLAVDLSWHPNARIVREDRAGIAYARTRGMQEAKGDLLVFVDDDNVLAADYLEQAFRIEREWPMLGVWGSGAIRPEFEVSPPEEFSRYLAYLALREVRAPLWSNVIPCLHAMPWGAGQCLRAEVARAYCRQLEGSELKINSLNSRGKLPLHGGEDVEIGYVGCTLGFGVGVFPELVLTHIIPKERLTEGYLIKLGAGITVSNIFLDYKWRKISPESPIAGLLGIPRVVRNVLRRKGFDRRMYLAEIKSQYYARSIIRELANGKIEAGA